MDNRYFLYLVVFSICAPGRGFAQARQSWENPPIDIAQLVKTPRTDVSVQAERAAGTLSAEARAFTDAHNKRTVPGSKEHEDREPPGSVEVTFTASELSAVKTGKRQTYESDLEIGTLSSIAGIRSIRQRANPNCREWKDEACTECGIDSFLNLSVKNKTKTPLLVCRDMKPGPARVVMTTHAEPTISGLWEVEFGLGYQTSARSECPHQFIASNNPPLKAAYEVGPITVEGEIPSDGTIQTLACVGLSSARVGEEGKETGASLRVFKLRVVTE